MVAFAAFANAFQANVVVARLGAAGVLAQPRGGLGSMYPMGTVWVDVADDDLDLARQLVLADEIEAVFRH